MNRRVVSLSDRGRALEWLSIGFGVLLVADLVVALLLGEAKPSSARELAGLIEPARALVIAASAGHLIAIAALAVGLATLYRCGHRVWSVCALAASGGPPGGCGRAASRCPGSISATTRPTGT